MELGGSVQGALVSQLVQEGRWWRMMVPLHAGHAVRSVRTPGSTEGLENWLKHPRPPANEAALFHKVWFGHRVAQPVSSGSGRRSAVLWVSLGY